MIRRPKALLGSCSLIEPQRLCPRYRRRGIQYGTRKGNGFGEQFLSRNRDSSADAVSGGAAVCEVRLRRIWTRTFVDGAGLCWTRRAHISLVGLSAGLGSKANRYHGDRNQPGDRTMTQITVKNMMTAAFLTKAITAIITTITRVVPKPQATLAIPVAAPLRIRRQAQRRSGIFRSIGLIPPQYMPALARTHILRAIPSDIACHNGKAADAGPGALPRVSSPAAARRRPSPVDPPASAGLCPRPKVAIPRRSASSGCLDELLQPGRRDPLVRDQDEL
jgi:hypothetical protein